jgi:mevalonate pyrophosphate decarboxylase
MSGRKIVTYTAPTNIATIKYWGKKVAPGLDPELNLPINSSVSVTLNKGQLRTITTVVLGNDFTADRLWLNGR